MLGSETAKEKLLPYGEIQMVEHNSVIQSERIVLIRVVEKGGKMCWLKELHWKIWWI